MCVCELFLVHDLHTPTFTEHLPKTESNVASDAFDNHQVTHQNQGISPVPACAATLLWCVSGSRSAGAHMCRRLPARASSLSPACRLIRKLEQVAQGGIAGPRRSTSPEAVAASSRAPRCPGMPIDCIIGTMSHPTSDGQPQHSIDAAE